MILSLLTGTTVIWPDDELIVDFLWKLMEQELKSLNQESAEDALLTSPNQLRMWNKFLQILTLKKTSKSDIILQVTWLVNRMGPPIFTDIQSSGNRCLYG